MKERIDRYRRAIALDPRDAAAHHNLGQALRAQNDLAGAAQSLRTAITLAPNFGAALGALAEVLLVSGSPAEAVGLFEKALPLVPGDAALHAGLGDAQHALNHLPQAIAAYQQAVALDPASARAWWGMGCATLTQGEFAAAARALGRTVKLVPDSGEAWQNLGKALYKLGQVDPALEACRKAATLLPLSQIPLGTVATIIPGSPRSDNAAVLAARRAWAAVAMPAGQSTRSLERVPALQKERLRIGYVSSFFPDCNWMKPVWGLINHHDRERFEIYLFSDASEASIRQGYRKDRRDQFHNITGLANAEVATLIQDQRIDVLVDLNGYSQPARLGLLVLRPAPVLVAWFNTFATSGLDCFDALIGDEHVLPEAEEAMYSEPVVRLPICYLTFEVTYPVPEVAPPPCRARGHITLGCLAPQYKITTEVVEAWSRVLRAVPTSRLLLKNTVLASADNRRFVLDLFTRFGIAAQRIELEGPAEHHEFLKKYADIDLALDTFPYNGGTTTMEALWQGVPVLAFPGDRWAARISSSMLRYAGLAEFVAPDQDGLVQLAIALADDQATPARLTALREGMRERLRQAPLCDVRKLAREMEAQCVRLYDRWRVRGEPGA